MKPIGITMGCPVGIGPEIIVKHFLGAAPSSPASIVIGDVQVIRRITQLYNLDIEVFPWLPGADLRPNSVPVYEVSNLKPETLEWGNPSKTTGQAMGAYIETAADMCKHGTIRAICTCPISKVSLMKAGYSYPGHTEMLAELSGGSAFTMMMAGAKLRVTLVTIHCGIKQMLSELSTEKILRTIELTHTSLAQDFNISTPKIAVAGLNPHAGEKGIFGGEEAEIIEPAIIQARKIGIDTSGPLPPDTVFWEATAGVYDAVVCLYHDQGLIPFKLLHFKDGVNVTIGLPIVRTSVDHGTAYNIAGKNLASAESLNAAVNLAALISDNRQKTVATFH